MRNALDLTDLIWQRINTYHQKYQHRMSAIAGVISPALPSSEVWPAGVVAVDGAIDVGVGHAVVCRAEVDFHGAEAGAGIVFIAQHAEVGAMSNSSSSRVCTMRLPLLPLTNTCWPLRPAGAWPVKPQLPGIPFNVEVSPSPFPLTIATIALFLVRMLTNASM